MVIYSPQLEPVRPLIPNKAPRETVEEWKSPRNSAQQKDSRLRTNWLIMPTPFTAKHVVFHIEYGKATLVLVLAPIIDIYTSIA